MEMEMEKQLIYYLLILVLPGQWELIAAVVQDVLIILKFKMEQINYFI